MVAVTQRFLPLLRAGRPGRVVNIGVRLHLLFYTLKTHLAARTTAWFNLKLSACVALVRLLEAYLCNEVGAPTSPLTQEFLTPK